MMQSLRCFGREWMTVLCLGLLLGGCGGGGDTSSSNESCDLTQIDKTDLPALPEASTFEDNPLYYQQWAIHYDRDFYEKNDIDPDASIHMDGDHRFLGRKIKVAVIDDALDTTHEDLVGAIVATYDVATGTTDVMPRSDEENHGTEVTGVLAARNNDLGIAGVAPAVELYFIRLPFPNVYISDIIKAFDKAKEWGVDVVNCSWGSGDVDDAVKAAIVDLAVNGRDGNGTVIVFAAGNEDQDIGNDESSLPEVIAVGATNKLNRRSYYSNYGRALDVMAPGGERLGITTLDQMGDKGASASLIMPNYLLYNDYPNAFAGTSASAPIVAGVVAQLLEANPRLTRENIYDVLTCTADKIGPLDYDDKGFNLYYGYGKVNVDRALAAVR